MVAVMTDRIYPDEPCYGLQEGPEWRVINEQGTQAKRWVQKVWVIRGDRKARYESDIGPASDWPDATPIIYASVGDDTVAELQWLAERDRRDDKWAKRRRELLSESTLIKDILRQEEAKMQMFANRSVFGDAVSVQRVDFPSQFIQRKAKEKRNERRSRNRV